MADRLAAGAGTVVFANGVALLMLVTALLVAAPPAAGDETPLVEAVRANLTVDGVASQSSDFSDTSTADRAIDEATNGDLGSGSVAVTAAQANAWWQVDLGEVHEIPAIRVYGRTDCCTDRLGDFSVFVSDAPFASDAIAETRAQPGVTEYPITANTLTTVDINVGRTGRYVRVQLHGTDHLQLAEVLVGGPDFEIAPDVVPSWGARGLALSLNDNIESEIFAIEQIGNTLYVGGRFQEALSRRFDPPVDQPFLMALNATTGQLLNFFRPDLDGAVYALKAAPDGSRLYVGGEFYSVNGEPGTGALVALDPRSGRVVDGWQTHLHKFFSVGPALVKTLELSGGYLYAGGSFTNTTDATGTRRTASNVARFRVSDSTVDQSWRPTIQGGTVFGIAVSQAWERVYIGGKFGTVNGEPRDAFATLTLADAQLTGPESITRNSTGQTDVYDILAVDDLVFVAGSEHNTIVYRASDFSIVNWVFTRSAGGDNQDLELVGNRVYSVCHCRGGPTNGGIWDNYRPGRNWSTVAQGTYKGEVEGVYAVSAKTGAFIDTFPYSQFEDQWAISAGGWAIHGSPDGCVWLGGDFNRAATGDPYVNSLARLCRAGGPVDLGLAPPTAPPPDTTAPPPPAAVQSSASERTVTVTITPPGATADVAYYSVYRDGEIVARSRSTSVTLRNEPAGDHVYGAAAADHAGNTSARRNGAPLRVWPGAYTTYVDGRFDNWIAGSEYLPFTYEDGVLGGVVPARAEALYSPDGAITDDGAGVVMLGGKVTSGTVTDMAGAFTTTFTLDEPGPVTLSFDYRMFSAAAQGPLSTRYAVDGVVTTVASQGSGASSPWTTHSAALGDLAAGTHTLAVGGHLASKSNSFANWWAKVAIDDVVVASALPGIEVVDPPSEPVGHDPVTVRLAASDHTTGPDGLQATVTPEWSDTPLPATYDDDSGLFEAQVDVSSAPNGHNSLTAEVVNADGLAAQDTVQIEVDNTPLTYADVVGASAPAVWWRMDDPAGTAAGDATGNVDGTFVGGPQLDRPGLVSGGTAVLFDGVDDGVHVPDSNLINLGTRRTAHSLEAWFSTASAATRQVIYEQGGSTRGAAIYIADGQLHGGFWNLSNDGSTDTPWAAGPAFVATPITAGDTHHVVVTFDRAADAVTMYLDGAEVGQVSGVGYLYAHGSDAGVGVMHDGIRFHDGAVNGDGYPFAGTIDEVAVYPHALTASEVTAHHDAG
jgi:hypothetical protein